MYIINIILLSFPIHDYEDEQSQGQICLQQFNNMTFELVIIAH